MDARGMRLADLADELLSRILDRRVVDKTGLDGRFDFHLEFTPDDTTPLGGPSRPSRAADLSGLSIFTALEDQLGLVLKSDTATGDILVIDYLERPSEN